MYLSIYFNFSASYIFSLQKIWNNESVLNFGKTGSETFEILKETYGHDAMPKSLTHYCFKEGRRSVESDKHPGRPFTSRNAEIFEKVHTLMKVIIRLMIRELCDKLGFSIGSGQSIWTEDLKMRQVTIQFVPQLLIP